MDINLLSEKKSLYNFLSLYIFLTLIIFTLASFSYYTFQKELTLTSHLPKLQSYAKDVIFRLRQMHNSLLADNYYPRYSNFKSAIYDDNFVKIFSLLEDEHPNFSKMLYKKGKHIYFIKEPALYYLGAKYVVIEIKDKEQWISKTLHHIFFFGLFFLIFMAILGYYLVKQFLKPMKNSIVLLDNFIKDTTHELNTPISTILTNIETIDKKSLEPKTAKKIERIEIAARTISHIYQDLTYMLLRDKLPTKYEGIDLNELLAQRISYFQTLADAKKIKISFLHSPSFIKADRKKLSRLIDNLLSNAIKYNRIGGAITIKTFKNGFFIQDSGHGIPKEKQEEIFKRYKRLSSSEGGFGIGLNIVFMIAKEFDMRIKIDSKINQFTRITISWE